MKQNPKRDELIRVGSDIIVQHGFNNVGINAVLTQAGVPKGSFYYYFASKEEFGLAVIDAFASSYSAKLADILDNPHASPLTRLRHYFEAGIVEMENCQCTQGCLIGNLAQELSGQSELFRHRLNQVLTEWEQQITACLDAARAQGELGLDQQPKELARFILASWEGAILRAKTTKSVEPMQRFVRILFEQVLS